MKSNSIVCLLDDIKHTVQKAPVPSEFAGAVVSKEGVN